MTVYAIKNSIFFLFVLTLGVFSSCKSDPAETEETAIAARPKVPVPAFNRDSAFVYLKKQVEFGPRVVNTEAHQATKTWLVEKFKSFGAEVIEQNFTAKAYTGENLNGTNIIAQYQPENRRRILLAAHWDSRHVADSPLSTERQDEPILGADDGGSGVSVLLEVARQLGLNPVDVGVDIVLFDAEDYGENKAVYATDQEREKSTMTWGLGSQHWAKNPHFGGIKPVYAILLDMVGGKGAYFPKEQYSKYFAPQMVEKVWDLAENMGYGNYFVNKDGGGVTDDHYFVNTIAGIPMIDIINLPPGSENKGFADHWHTHNDDLDVIDPRTLRAVGQVLLAVIYRENNGTM